MHTFWIFQLINQLHCCQLSFTIKERLPGEAESVVKLEYLQILWKKINEMWYQQTPVPEVDTINQAFPFQCTFLAYISL